MVLSIGMIVRDGEQYLEQCLTALQPIFRELDSELIIADTGSTDRTVEIAKKFTDNVFYFEWVNDFSAARNSTLERAQGEWFMYIDQDEVAVDCTGLIKFFKSGEYKKYNTAAYVQRNLKRLDDPTQYSDFRQIVAVKRLPETKFVNEFHEALYPTYAPLKFLDFIVLHYGFAYSGEGGAELAKAKSERNLKGLFDEIEHTVGEPRPNIYKQISDCYSIIGDMDTALKYLDEGLEKTDRSQENIVIMYYESKIQILLNLQRFDEVIALSEEYFDVTVNPFHTKDISTDCMVRAYTGWSYYALGQYQKAIGQFIKFFDLYKRYTSGKLLTDELTLVSWTLFDEHLKKCFNDFLISCVEEGEYELAEKFARNISLEKFLNDETFIKIHLEIRMTLMANTGFNDFGSLYSRLDSRRKEYMRRKFFKLSPHDLDMVLKKMSVLGGSAKELAEIYGAAFRDDRVDMEKISAFLKAYGSETSHDILNILLKCQMDITPFVLAEDFSAEGTVKTMGSLFENSVELFESYNVEKVSPDGLSNVIKFYSYLMQWTVETEHPISALFEKYVALGARWYKTFGKAEMPREVSDAMFASGVVIAKQRKDRNGFEKALAEVRKYAPDLADIANKYEWENTDAFPEQEQKPQSEFEQLVAKVKQDIRNLIVAGNLADAKALLGEFKAICPNDPDISAIAGELGGV